MTTHAITRRTDVVSRVEGDETLVLDLETQTAHCLSGDVALVWNSAETSASGIASATGLSSAAVEQALRSLLALGLAVPASGLSRRTLVVRGAAVGGAVVAAGAISIPLPAAAAANSTTFSISRTCNASTKQATFTFVEGKSTLNSGQNYAVTFSYQDAGTPSTLRMVTFTLGTNGSGKPQTVTNVAPAGASASANVSNGSITITTGSSFGGGTVTLDIKGTAGTDEYRSDFTGVAACP